MKDIKINNLKLNARNELSFKVTIKELDYTLWEKELLKQAEINWNMLDVDIIWLVEWDKKENRDKKLKNLHSIMLVYAEKSWEKFEKLKDTLYTKYSIESRKNLNDSDLDQIIESYRVWLLEFN